jgi:retron-type reverse transcriptase
MYSVLTMSSRKQLEKLIEKEEVFITSLRSSITDIESQIKLRESYIQGLRDSLKYLPKIGNGTDAPPQLRPGSEIATVRDILTKAAKPLHVTEILKLMGKEASKNNRTSTSGYLSSYVRKGQFFKKTAPNTFAVIDADNASQTTLPPEDFGTDKD